MKRWLSALFAAMCVCAAAGCVAVSENSEPDAARPTTTEESQLLAIARFNNFDLGTRGFTTNIQERGVELRVQGWVNYTEHFGYAAVTGAFPSQVLVWTSSLVGITEQEPDALGNPLLPMPSLDDPALTTATLDPATSRLDALLAIIGSLGSDRPDNPLLLQQSGALWLRADRIEETAVTVFAAPPSDAPRDASSPPLTADTSSLRLWVDDSGEILRAEARIGDTWSSVDFSEAADLPGTRADGAFQ